jgi:hypothetical protein
VTDGKCTRHIGYFTVGNADLRVCSGGRGAVRAGTGADPPGQALPRGLVRSRQLLLPPEGARECHQVSSRLLRAPELVGQDFSRTGVWRRYSKWDVA